MNAKTALPVTPQATECSKRLGRIEHSQFQTALDRLDLGKLCSVTPITAGNFGQNVFLTTDRGEYVFRGCPHYPWQFPKERYFARGLAQRTSVPVPWPYRLDLDSSIFGWPYVMMPRMPGIQLSDDLGSLSESDRVAISCQLGWTLKGLQQFSHDACGEYDSYVDEIRPFSVDHFRWVSQRLTGLVRTAGETLSDADRQWIDSLLARAREALLLDFVPVFVMQDFKAGNTVALKTGGQWTISGVFDFMEPYFSDGEIDVSRHTYCCLGSKDPRSAVAFISAFVQAGGFRSGAGFRMPVYALLDRLIIWNFGWRHGRPWWDPDLSFRDWMDLPRLQEVFQQGGVPDAYSTGDL